MLDEGLEFSSMGMIYLFCSFHDGRRDGALASIDYCTAPLLQSTAGSRHCRIGSFDGSCYDLHRALHRSIAYARSEIANTQSSSIQSSSSLVPYTTTPRAEARAPDSQSARLTEPAAAAEAYVQFVIRIEEGRGFVPNIKVDQDLSVFGTHIM